jgi:hypothetical protein
MTRERRREMSEEEEGYNAKVAVGLRVKAKTHKLCFASCIIIHHLYHSCLIPICVHIAMYKRETLDNSEDFLSFKFFLC